MPVPMLDFAPQNAAVKQKVLDGLSGLIDRSQFVLGENVKGLEAELAAYTGAKHAIGMSSGTDALLVALDKQYPQYGLAGHKGYPTPAHLAALKAHGVCPIYRHSFAPVRAIVANPPLWTDEDCL